MILLVGEDGTRLLCDCDMFDGEVIEGEESKLNLNPRGCERVEDEAICQISIIRIQRESQTCLDFKQEQMIFPENLCDPRQCEITKEVQCLCRCQCV